MAPRPPPGALLFSYAMLFLSPCRPRLRCFGLLLSPGKNVKNSDMHLLDLVGLSPALCLRLCADFCLANLF